LAGRPDEGRNRKALGFVVFFMEATMSKRHLCVLAAAVLLLAGCKKKNVEQGAATPGPAAVAADSHGTTVKFHYTLTVDGKQIESSVGKEPLSATLGSGQIIPGLEEALANMKAGDKRSVTIAPEKGYGPYHDEGVQKVPKTAFKDMPGLKVGMMVTGQSNGRTFQARVKTVGDKDITLDLNHPLAGKTLNFDVEVVSVQTAGG